MGKGIDAARAAGAGIHADVLDDFKDQLLVVFLKRLLGGKPGELVVPVAETDDTGSDLLAFAVRDGNFIFEWRRKQMTWNGWEVQWFENLKERVAALEAKLGIEQEKPIAAPEGCKDGLTTDPKHADLGHGSDDKPVSQNKCYLVLSDEERAKGFVRPMRRSYVHVGIAGPRHPLRDLTVQERGLYGDEFEKYEEYPKPNPDGSSSVGRFWSQKDLDSVGKGCGTLTTMGRALAETYAREPSFYGSTYCCGCYMHRPVGAAGEFVWDGTDERVGT